MQALFRLGPTRMIATLAVALEPVSRRARLRLLVAFTLSLVLHVVLLLSVPVNPTGGMPNVVATIYARLEPATPEPAVNSEPPPPDATLIPADTATVPAVEAVEPKPPPPQAQAETKPEPKPVTPPPYSPSGGIELPLIRDPTYYPAKQLDVYPQPLTAIKLDYPESAAAERIDGRLLMLLLIDEFGVVNEASVVEAHPEGYFEETTLSVFRATRFSPAQKQGHPVKSRVLLQVKYLYGESEGGVR
jgi:periplasmic protein TonB